jgi:hypothetical protein
MTVGIAVVESSVTPEPAPAAPRTIEQPQATEDELRTQAMSDPAAQALFEIFPVEKSRVEEI